MLDVSQFAVPETVDPRLPEAGAGRGASSSEGTRISAAALDSTLQTFSWPPAACSMRHCTDLMRALRCSICSRVRPASFCQCRCRCRCS